MTLSKIHYLFFGTLRRQLITGVAMVHAVMMSLFLWDLVARQQTLLLNQQISLAKSLTESVARTSAVWLTSRDLAGLQEIIEAERSYPELEYAMVLDKQGNVLAHTDLSLRGQYVRDLPAAGAEQVLNQTAKLVDVINPVLLNGHHIGWVRIGIGQLRASAELATIMRDGMLYALAAIIVGGFAAATMGTRLTRRLHSIQTVADAVEAGSSRPRVRTDGTDEAAQLGRQFNTMLDTLAEREQELHASHDALHQSESRYRSIIEASPVPIALNDDALNITYLNPAFIRRFGYTLDDIPTLNDWWPLAYPDSAYRQYIANEWLGRIALRSKSLAAFEPMEANIRTKDGSICTVLASAAPLGEEFADTHMVILYDITERKHAENALRASEQRFHAIADYTVDWENWVSPEGKLLWVNSSVEQLTGYTPAECMAMADFPLPMITEPDREAVRQKFAGALNNGRGYFEFRILHKNGSTSWASVSWQPIYDAEGKHLGHRSSVSDISERKHIEDSLRKLSAAVEQSANSIIITDTRSIIEYVNPAFSAHTGYSRDEVIGKTPRIIQSGQTPAAHYKELWRTILSGQTWYGEIKNKRKDGSYFWVYYAVSPIKDAAGNTTHYLGTQTDITEQKQREAELHQYRNELEKRVAERTAQMEIANRELEAFAYSVSHDLRAPLRAIDGFSRIILEDHAGQLDTAGMGYLHRVRNAVQRMGQLIDDLLELSRVSRAELQTTRLDLSRLAQGVLQQLQSSDPGRHVDVVIAPQLLAMGDEILLRLVLQNLLGNAWKYTRHTANACIELDSLQEGDTTVYFVRDNGVGFDMQFADKLFSAFQRLHKADEFPGSGIGLATVARIIHRHGGRVWAQAEIGKGATFFFTLGTTPVGKTGAAS